jgi:hypothetical protein
MKTLILSAAALILSACQPANDSNPGERPPGAPPSDPGSAPTTPAFVGSWVADPNWCSNTSGPEQPILITETEFRGYENTCEISELQPVDGDEWTATFVCQAEGVTTRQPVRMEADADDLELTWVQDGGSVEWRRCPA